MKRSLFMSLLLVLGFNSVQAQVPAPAVAAHEAYVNGNGTALLAKIRETLVSTNNQPTMVRNMMALYAAAKKNGVLANAAPDWRRPKELSYLGINVQRKYRTDNGKVNFTLAIGADYQKDAVLEQVQVIRYPSQVLLDKAAGIGELYPNENDSRRTIYFTTSGSATPIEEGLYLINLKIAGQPMMQGWFLLDNLNSSAAPIVSSPKPDATLSTRQPSFQWTKFRSPEFRDGETVKLSAKVNAAEGGSEFLRADLKSDLSTSFKVGDHAAAKDYSGVSTLGTGDYHFSVAYNERTMFGDLLLSRSSRTIVPFSIR